MELLVDTRSNPSSPSSYTTRFKMNGSRPSTPVSGHEPPQGASLLDQLKHWDDGLVHKWLSECKCAHHAPLFAENDIRGDIILDLDQSTLKEMGISAVGDRIRILNAVKALRMRSSGKLPKSQRLDPPRARLQILTDSGANNQELSSPNSRTPGKRLDATRPPPLHISPPSAVGSPSLPQLVRNNLDRPRPLPQPSSGHSHTLSSSSVIRGLPPLPPPPKSQPPAPPAGQTRPTGTTTPNNGAGRTHLAPQIITSGRRTPTQSETPPSFTKDPLPPAPGAHQVPTTPSGASGSWSGEYGLPRGPSPGNVGGGRLTNAPPRISQRNRGLGVPNAAGTSPVVPAHAKSGSLSTPNTGNHPYASSTPSSLQPPQANVGPLTLSPIAESFLSQHSASSGSSTPSPPTHSSTNGFNVSSGSGSHAVGRTPFRPATPSGRHPMSHEEIKRKCVKFISPDDNSTRLINLEDCQTGRDVFEIVLRKFGKAGGIGFPTMSGPGDDWDQVDHDVSHGFVVDGWGLFLNNGHHDNPGSPLLEEELIAICHADPDTPARLHGLTLRRVENRPKRPKVLPQYYSEDGSQNTYSQQSPKTPTYPYSAARGEDDGSSLHPRATSSEKQMHRASSISILSSLGVRDPERTLAPPDITRSASATPVPSTTTPLKTEKLRNFLGQRPPSELITNHLQEFFPFTEKKVLERTKRQTLLFRKENGSSRPESVLSGKRRFSRQSWNSVALERRSVSPSRISYKSSVGNSPRMSLETENGDTVDLEEDSASPPRKSSHLLPPVQFSNESLTDTLRHLDGGHANKRMSLASVRSSSSKRLSYLGAGASDTASLLTVDEITQEVESRRASMIEQGKDPDEGGVTPSDDQSSTLIGEDDEDGTKVEETGEREEDEGEGSDEDDVIEKAESGEQTAATEVKQAIKWIKGALIGAGSFGSVYLGMDAFHGLLMAVKQVELPTGSAPNEERKKNMLHALEREIELLKTLQHENIVQYLDSSSDGVHLNIFLEYVPGGSVATLLRNYGAFEEALVRNWVRQILQGLNYLHSRDIIHRDIKGANILVDNKGGIKISDFGISKKVEDNLMSGARVHRPSLQGSVFWMAPEVVKQTSYTLKADIWSVGCLVVEMLTGEHPWAQLTQMQAIFKIGSSAKPTIPSEISSEAEDFLDKTFELDHMKRPSGTELLQHPWMPKDPFNLAGQGKSKVA